MLLALVLGDFYLLHYKRRRQPRQSLNQESSHDRSWSIGTREHIIIGRQQLLNSSTVTGKTFLHFRLGTEAKPEQNER
jgi:hypothetical protein